MEDHLDVLLELLGPNGTIVFPTHSWSTFKDGFGEFDPEHTQFDYLFSEFCRTNLDLKRTKHCLASIAAYGKDAEAIIITAQNRNPYGVLSPFDALVSKNALHVSIGMPVSSTISAVHHCELMAQIPYRFNDWQRNT
jgi:aminoglycoside 3-N-acetyltransferase